MMPKALVLLSLLSLFSLLSAGALPAAAEVWEPWGFVTGEAKTRASQWPRLSELDFAIPVAQATLVVYQQVFSRTNGKPCPMYPNCSRYSRLAFKNGGPLKAFLQTFDRLHRCGHDLKYYDLVWESGLGLRYDPPTP